MMVSFNIFNGHSVLYVGAIVLVCAVVLVIALFRKDNVKASGWCKHFGFSLEATNHRSRKTRNSRPKTPRATYLRVSETEVERQMLPDGRPSGS
jgi:hypothetical protein